MPRVTDDFGRPVSGQMPGLVEALVVDNVDPLKLGRIKVKFPTLPDMPEAFWARLSMPHAGISNNDVGERGWMTIPEIDDEVLVTFIRGDIDHAVVLGSLYNGVDVPPYANEDGENNLRVFYSRSNHRVIFDDTDGAEKVDFLLHNDQITTTWDAANKKLTLYCGMDLIIEAVGDVSIKCTDWVLNTNMSTNIKSTGNMTIKHGTNFTSKAGAMTIIKGSLTSIN